MAGGLRGNEPHGDVDSADAMPTQDDIEKMLYNSVFTFRIEEEPLFLTDVAAIFTAMTQLHVKLTLIDWANNYDVNISSVVEYLTTDGSRRRRQRERAVNLTVASITKNSPLTISVFVSEALGKALSSIIDAVSQSGIRYKKAKLENEKAELELEQAKALAVHQNAQLALQLKQQSEVHDMAMIERLIEMQSRILELESQQVLQRGVAYDTEQDNLHRISEAAIAVVSQLHPRAEVETRQLLAQAVMNNLIDLCNYSGLVVESVKPRESA